MKQTIFCLLLSYFQVIFCFSEVENKSRVSSAKNQEQITEVFTKFVLKTSKIESRPPILLSRSDLSKNLGDDLAKKIDQLENSYVELWKLYDFATEQKLDLPEEFLVADGNIPKDLIFFQTVVCSNELKLISVIQWEGEAEVIASLERPGDEEQKVWVKSKTNLFLYFAFENNLWKLREIIFKDAHNPHEFYSLSRTLEIKALENLRTIKIWRSVVSVKKD